MNKLDTSALAASLADEGNIRAARMSESRRGRPTADQVEAINGAILTTARHCFQTKGFEGTTMGAIAEAVGISKATLYSRYPDKLALLRAVMEDRLAAWGSVAVRPALPEGSSFEERLRRYAVTLLIRASSDEFRAFDRLASASWSEAGQVVAAVRHIGQEHYLKLIIRDIEAAGAADGCIPRDARRVAVSLLGIVSGLLAAESRDAPIDDAHADALGAFAVGLILRGRSAW